MQILENNHKVIEGSKIKNNILQIKGYLEFYGTGNFNINGMEIKNPMTFITNDEKLLDIAIDITQPISAKGHCSSEYLSFTFNDYTEYERHLYLQWLINGRSGEVLSKFLTLFFRNLQHRACIDKKDHKIIIFELINIFSKYKSNYYYFNENYLNLLNYCIFELKEELTKEEADIIINFLNSNKNMATLSSSYSSLISKIEKNNFNENEIKEENISSLDSSNIAEIICDKIQHDSENTEYCLPNLLLNIKSIKYKKENLLIIAIKLLLEPKKENFLKELILTPTSHKIYYHNYYLTSTIYYNVLNYSLKITQNIRKLIYEAISIVDEYQTNTRIFQRQNNRKPTKDSEKYELLPIELKNYFDKLNITNKKLPKNKIKTEERISFNIDQNKLNLLKEDTQEIKEILKSVFVEEAFENKEKKPNYVVKKEALTTSNFTISDKYFNFLLFLISKTIRTETELKLYCKENSLMLNDALNTINDYCDEIYGDFIMDDNLNINKKIANLIEKQKENNN